MTCQHCSELLTDYQHSQLDAASDAAVHAHLQSCAACRQELAVQSALTETLRAAYATQLEMPTSVLAGVRQAVRRDSTFRVVEALRGLLRPIVVAPTAAAIVLAAGFASHLTSSSVPPQLSTDFFVQQHVAHTMNSQSGDRAWNAYLLTSNNDENANASSP